MRAQADRNACFCLRSKDFTLAQIAHALDICARTVHRWLKGESAAARPLNRNHTRKLTSLQEERLIEFFLDKNTSRLRDGVAFVAQSFNLCVSERTLGRILHRHRLSFKRAVSAYHEADRARQQVFLANLPRDSTKSWIALDEAAFFLNHSRKYAWSKRGTPAVVDRPSNRGRMHSLILTTSPDGVVDWRLIQDSVDSLRFHAFLSGLPGDTNVLLDNCATHHASHVLVKQGKTTVSQVARSKQMTLNYLPPYSPQLNPVELCFNLIRTHVNRTAPRTLGSLHKCIQTAIRGLTPAVCRSMFRKCLLIG
uniref:Tc1-like transposase DDE domain-containing protein n=1 Tax=Globisporangium ultimum (strain ATCC 200006 / CBS 805.95 / DAOM BR144) TaxID=431595 RepID=K3WWK9_GLOUD